MAERSPSDADLKTTGELARLEELVRTLRARCPWDRRQTHLSLAPHLLEEAYEALEAIEELGSPDSAVSPEVVAHLREELGDVLFQVFFHSVLAEEEGRFTLADVARDVHDKLVRRHPHVFGDALADTPEEVAARWEVLKSSEKGHKGVTGGIPDAMPALAVAAKLLRKAELLGVDLPSVAERRSRVSANLDRLAAAGESGSSGEESRAVGEMLLCVADLARRIGVDPETALRAETRGLRHALETGERPGSESQ
ncbi:MAG: MazG family protein [Acidimicrobiales bacterium]|jgi:MazG family protein